MSLDHQSKTTVKVTGYQFSGCPATAGLGLLCKNQTARERRTEATSYDWSPRFTPKGAHGDRGRCIRSTWLDSWLYLVRRGLKKKRCSTSQDRRPNNRKQCGDLTVLRTSVCTHRYVAGNPQLQPLPWRKRKPAVITFAKLKTTATLITFAKLKTTATT